MKGDPVVAVDLTGRQLWRACALSAVVAAAILVVAVLPAEYGLDPLGTGRALGLMRGVAPEPPPPSIEAAMSPVTRGAATQYGAPYRVDRRVFELGPYEFVEYKYHLPKSANFVFAWQASEAVGHDFHGAPDGQGPEAEVSLDNQPKSHAAGALTAAFTGMHGWYFENLGTNDVTITVDAAGFFTQGVERRASGRRVTHDLVPPPRER